jgi:hypothetical protein
LFTALVSQPKIHNKCIEGDQQENRSRVLPHLLFYPNVCLSWIIHILCILAMQWFYWLPASQKIYY